jgi:hypothetical protein
MPRKSKAERAITALQRERQSIVRLLLENPEFGCYSRVGKILGIVPSKCWYWHKKLLDHTFHASKRNVADELATFKSWELPDVHRAVVWILEGSCLLTF